MSENNSDAKKGRLRIILNKEALTAEEQQKLLRDLAELGGITPGEITDATVTNVPQDSPKP